MLNEVVSHALDFTREYAKMHGVELEANLAGSMAPMMGNTTELEQVVVNLVHNAVQACGESGRVTVETCQEGDRLRLRIRDNGCGMAPEQIEHAFDPFYTTRVEKGGTGLGLSTVHGIVTGSEGTIEIASDWGRGTVFTVEFPRVPGGGNRQTGRPAPG